MYKEGVKRGTLIVCITPTWKRILRFIVFKYFFKNNIKRLCIFKFMRDSLNVCTILSPERGHLKPTLYKSYTVFVF